MSETSIEPRNPNPHSQLVGPHISFAGAGRRWIELSGDDPPYAVWDVLMKAFLGGALERGESSAVFSIHAPPGWTLGADGLAWRTDDRDGQQQTYVTLERRRENWFRCDVAIALTEHKCPLPTEFAKLSTLAEMHKKAKPLDADGNPRSDLKTWTFYLKEQGGDVLEDALQKMATIPVKAYPQFFREAYFPDLHILFDDFAQIYRASLLEERIPWERYWPGRVSSGHQAPALRPARINGSGCGQAGIAANGGGRIPEDTTGAATPFRRTRTPSINGSACSAEIGHTVGRPKDQREKAKEAMRAMDPKKLAALRQKHLEPEFPGLGKRTMLAKARTEVLAEAPPHN